MDPQSDGVLVCPRFRCGYAQRRNQQDNCKAASNNGPVSFFGLSRSDLPSWMLLRLVASILGLQAKPKSRKGGEILELDKVS
jgi:hypothetical protein